MKSQSLKFFPRESKLSSAEELLLSDFNLTNKEKVANQRLESFAVYIMLLMKMSEDDDAGYFLEFNQDNKNLLASKIGTDNKFLNRVVFRCLERGLFDKAMYQKYNILTSADIQDKYFFGKQRCTKLRVVKDYLYDFIYENYENVLKKSIIVNKNGEIVNKNKQTTQDKTNTNTEDDKQADVINNKLISFKNFSLLFPKKISEDFGVKDIPDYVNLELLTEKINESPQFLKQYNNLSLKWCCKEKNYNNIINDKYKSIEQNSFKNKNQNFDMRDYSQEDRNQLYTDLTKIDI